VSIEFFDKGGDMRDEHYPPLAAELSQIAEAWQMKDLGDAFTEAEVSSSKNSQLQESLL
jgi:hypothetical protein